MSQPVDVTCIEIDNSCNTDNSLITDAYTVNIQTRFNQNLNYPITVEVIYVGDAADPNCDQILDSAELDVQINGDGTPALTQFQLQTDSIDLTKIKPENYFGVTAIIINFKFQGQDFFRCGYYVYQDYINDDLIQNPPQQPVINQIHRKILADKPRVTNYQINWNPSEAEIQQKQLLQQQPQNQYDNLKADLFKQSNGIFDQLNQIPTYQPPQEAIQQYQNIQQQQQQQFSNQNIPFQQQQQQCQQQMYQQQNQNIFGQQQMPMQQQFPQQNVFVQQNSIF